MKPTTLIGIVVLASAGAIVAGCERDARTIARGDPSQPSPAFEVLDQNRDGYLSKLEADDRIGNYDAADSNDDGRLDRQEFAAVISPAAAAGGSEVGPRG